MIETVHLDPSTPFETQLKAGTGPVVLVNTFFVPEGEAEKVLELWQDDALYMKRQPGYISAQLHRGVGGSNLLANVAVWESTEALVNAFTSEEFQAKHNVYPEGIVMYPHVFTKIAVDGVCVA